MPEEKSRDRQRQVDTMRKRYGPDVYRDIAKKRQFSDPYMAKRGAWKRWHPDRFDAQGTLLPEWEEQFYANNNQGK